MIFDAVERGLVPDALVRTGIRALLWRRLSTIEDDPAWFQELARGPIADSAADANKQHYEVPAPFYTLCLGPRLKYSSCLYSDPNTTLAEAEEAMLALTCQRARVEDGMHVLDLGCGWGSLTLWLAEQYPHSAITAVSNSSSQRDHIMTRAQERGFGNVSAITADINDFEPHAKFDRVITVEMMEHCRNYQELLRRIASWLNENGELFVHIFCHRRFSYPYETEGSGNWMARNFFTGGIMPSFEIFDHFQNDLIIAEQWMVDGRHYSRTLEDWLVNLDERRDEAERIFAEIYGPHQVQRWIQRWRMFYMACAELFAYHDGEEWHVGHYRLIPK